MAPKYACIVCTKGVRGNFLAISCDVCKKWCHISCNTTISCEDYMELKTDHSDFDWLCDQCKHKEEDMAVDMTIKIMSETVPDKRRRLNSELISAEAGPLEQPLITTPGFLPLRTRVNAPATPHTPAMPHTPAVPDISSMADITHCSFVVPEIIEHQDIGNELPAFAIAEELPELSYNVVEGATCHQKTRLVSSHIHVFNKKKTLK